MSKKKSDYTWYEELGSIDRTIFKRLEQSKNAKRGARDPEGPKPEAMIVDFKAVAWKTLSAAQFRETCALVIANKVTVPIEPEPQPTPLAETMSAYIYGGFSRYESARFFENHTPGKPRNCPFDSKFFAAIEAGMESARIMERPCSVLWARFDRYRETY